MSRTASFGNGKENRCDLLLTTEVTESSDGSDSTYEIDNSYPILGKFKLPKKGCNPKKIPTTRQ